MCNFSTSRSNQEKSINTKDRKKKTQERQEKEKAKMIEINQNLSVVSRVNLPIRKNCYIGSKLSSMLFRIDTFKILEPRNVEIKE